MEVHILGAHNLETRNSRLTSLLIDGVLALDAGSISSGLTLQEQKSIQAIILSHRHFDHVRDLLTLGLATRDLDTTVNVYGIPDTVEHVLACLMNGKLYPNFTQSPSADRPKYRFHALNGCQRTAILNYEVMAVPVPHGVPSAGLQVSLQQASLFYTGDAGKGLSSAWRWVSPGLLVVEVTYSSRWERQALDSGHLTPAILADELRLFQKEKGCLPRVVTVHMHPALEGEIRQELAKVSRELGVEIVPGHEGLRLTV